MQEKESISSHELSREHSEFLLGVYPRWLMIR